MECLSNPLRAEAESRATLYWWFSTLYARELDQALLAALQGEQGQTLLAELAAEPALAEQVIALRRALVRIGEAEIPHLELAAEYAQLFLGDARSGAPPYASVYRSENRLLYQEPHDEMVRLLEEDGLVVEGGFKEPADHLAIQLDYLGNLAMQFLDADDAALAELTGKQIAFIRGHLMSWLPAFEARVGAPQTSGFYPAVTALLLAFLGVDLEALGLAEN